MHLKTCYTHGQTYVDNCNHMICNWTEYFLAKSQNPNNIILKHVQNANCGCRLYLFILM